MARSDGPLRPDPVKLPYSPMMRIDPDKPGLLGLLRGDGEPAMRVLAWLGVVVLAPLLIAGTIVCWSPYL